MPEHLEGGNAGDTKTIYYSAGKNEADSSCGEKPAWAMLPCKEEPAGQPKGENPEILVTRDAEYNAFGEPTKVIESPGGKEESGNTRTTTIAYDSAGRKVSTKQSGGGASLPKSETLYDEKTGRPVTQQLICSEKCEGFDSQAVHTTYDKLGQPIGYEDVDGGSATTKYNLLGKPETVFDGKGTQDTPTTKPPAR